MARYPQAVLVSCEIPWDKNEDLMEELFRKEVRLIRKTGFRHIYIFGTCGEGYAVDTRRFREIVQVFYEETRGDDIHPMVAVIAFSTANAIERVGIAHDAGFRTFQIVLPCWGRLRDPELLTYFKDVCGTFEDSKFVHYNIMRAKRILTGTDYRRLIEAIPNLVGTKSGGGLAEGADLVQNAAELQHFLDETAFAHGCLYGECSLLSSFAPMVPKKTLEYFEAGRTGQIERLLQLQHDFYNLDNDVFGPLNAEHRIAGAYDKMIMRMGCLEEMPLRLLSPYECFTEEQYQAAKRVYQEKYSHWSAGRR